jgi:hypothetical protein
VDSNTNLHSTCTFCGAEKSPRLGFCVVCDRAVCHQCGNVQYTGGERKVVHQECLHKHEDGFSMIKFVR